MTVVPRQALLAVIRMPGPGADGARLRAMATGLAHGGWIVSVCELGGGTETSGARRQFEQKGVAAYRGLSPSLIAQVEGGLFDLLVPVHWSVFEQLLHALGDALLRPTVVIDASGLPFMRSIRHGAASAGAADRSGPDVVRRELDAYSAADAVLVESETEAAALAGALGSRAGVHVAGFVVEPLPCPVGPVDRRGLVFAGSFDRPSYVEAVDYLCNGILPRLEPGELSRHPLTLVAGAPPEHLKATLRGTPGVRVAGLGATAAAYLRRARLSVAPFLDGQDVERILGSLAAGTPVVATSTAIEGSGLEAGVHLAITNTAWEFARTVEELVADDSRWCSLADAGRAHVAGEHGVEDWQERFRAIVEAATVSGGSVRSAGETAAASRWRAEYRQLREGFGPAVVGVTPADAQILVVSGGDEHLVVLDGRRAAHFPQDGDGGHASFHPTDGDAALSHLRALVDRGARYLAVPSTSLYWLHRYPALHDHLRHARLHRSVHASVYELEPAVPRVVHVVVAAPADIAGAIRDVAPSTCTVEARVWDGVGPPPLEPDWAAELVVLVRSGTFLPPAFLDQLVALAGETGLDVLQPALEVGIPGPPAYEGQAGIAAREMAVLAHAPVLAARPGAVAELLAALDSGDAVIQLPSYRNGVLDALRVGVDLGVAWRLREAAPTAPTVRAVWTSEPVGEQCLAVDRPPPEVSVVIATYRRPDLLAACLESFVAQDIPPIDFEVVVVDDGSGDGTSEVLDSFERRLPLVAVRIAHAGRSAAKNIGVLVARGRLVLFFDDDDVATTSLLDGHLRSHREHPEPELAVLGRTDWSPGLTVSPVMHYLTEVGMFLFSYPKLTPGQQLDFRYFWEGRVSCKRAFLLANGLHDQRLAYTIDIELGYRLSMAGLKVVYEPQAQSHMVRPITFDDFLRRCEGKGRAALEFSKLQPDPVIRDYCKVDMAAGEWPDRARTHAAEIARVRELEHVAGGDHDFASSSVLEELHLLYHRVFVGALFKAISEAASDVAGPLLTVVVPVWSVTPELADLAYRTVERIWEVASVDTEVVVVDNGSPNGRDLRASAVVRWDENRGVAPAWNAGAAAGRGRFIAFVNSDAAVEPGWDAALCIAADGRRIAFPYTDHCDGLGFRRPDKAGTAGWAFALSRALFDELGPFDETFAPAYFEDTDYWHRAHVSGVSLNPVPAARVRHARRTTARHLDGLDEIFERNRRHYEQKHGLAFEAPPPYWHREIEDYVTVVT